MARGGYFSVDSLKGVHVLVAHDDVVGRNLVTSVLQYCGALVLTVSSAREALERMRLIKPDVLVANLKLPDADGYWLIQQVRAMKPEMGGEVPAIAIGDRPEEQERSLANGFQAYFVWPLNPWELTRAITGLTSAA